MSREGIDGRKYKADQQIMWDTVAGGWNRWWKTFELAGQHVSDHLIQISGLKKGDRILDIATGIGEPAISAARYIGVEGSITAVDQAPQMLAIAKGRAENLSIKNIEFRQMDAENLNFPEESFDTILARWGLMFLPDLHSALKGINRLLVPGGKFATSVWEKSPMISVAMETAQSMFNLPPLPEGTPSIFGLANGVLEERMQEAGFSEIQSKKLEVMFKYASADEFIAYSKDISAPIAMLLKGRREEEKDEFWRKVGKSAGEFAKNDGRIEIPGVTICAAGTRM